MECPLGIAHRPGAASSLPESTMHGHLPNSRFLSTRRSERECPRGTCWPTLVPSSNSVPRGIRLCQRGHMNAAGALQFCKRFCLANRRRRNTPQSNDPALMLNFPVDATEPAQIVLCGTTILADHECYQQCRIACEFLRLL
jgi:hypothetical protein